MTKLWKQSFCLATRYFPSSITVSDTRRTTLPTPEKATNLEYGLWLAHHVRFEDNDSRECRIRSDNLPRSTERNGYNVCIVTLECGSLLTSKFIKMRLNLQSSENIPSKRIAVKLANTLHLNSAIQDISEFLYYESKVDANVAIMKVVKHQLEKSSMSRMRII